MRTIFSSCLIALVTLTTITVAKNVTNIAECPSLTPRGQTTNVNNLRADDIKIVGALGDR